MLKDNEIRRLLSYLRARIKDENLLAAIEDELRGEDSEKIIREPEFVRYFPQNIAELKINETIWHLKIIPYTVLRMTQRGVNQEKVIALFTRFVEFCKISGEIISVGAYTIFSKSLTLRIDVDKVSDIGGEAHTVTIFFGKGNTAQTIVINFEQ